MFVIKFEFRSYIWRHYDICLLLNQLNHKRAKKCIFGLCKTWFHILQRFFLRLYMLASTWNNLGLPINYIQLSPKVRVNNKTMVWIQSFHCFCLKIHNYSPFPFYSRCFILYFELFLYVVCIQSHSICYT